MVINQAAQAQAQAQAQALQAAVNAGTQANTQRNPFWNVQGLSNGPPPMLAAGLPANFYPQMQAAAAAQENSTALVATAKLGPCKGNPEANSSLVVRSSVRKFAVNGGLLSVAQWTRKCVEENLDWLIKLAKRHFPDEKTILLAYGDGCETLVLIDDHANKMPADFRQIKKIGVGVSMANADEKSDEVMLATHGILQPSDSIWEHLRFEQVDTTGDKKDKCLFIHTSITVWTDSVEVRRRVLQVMTGVPEKPYFAVSYMPNHMFEQQVLAKWKEQGSARGQSLTGVESEPETLVVFNPKELILLEKAFDNLMTAKDLKSDASKYTEDDKRACQRVIKRAQDEFVMRGPPRKRRKKADKAKEGESKEVETKEGETQEGETQEGETKADKKAAPAPEVEKAAPAPEDKTAPTPKKNKRKSGGSDKAKEKEAKKGSTKEEEEKKTEDSDDEPISKLKPKVDAKTPSKKNRHSSGGKKSTTPKSKTPKDDDRSSKKNRGRPKGARNKSKEDASPQKSAKKSRRK
jgi:hypothetical protein